MNSIFERFFHWIRWHEPMPEMKSIEPRFEVKETHKTVEYVTPAPRKSYVPEPSPRPKKKVAERRSSDDSWRSSSSSDWSSPSSSSSSDSYSSSSSFDGGSSGGGGSDSSF